MDATLSTILTIVLIVLVIAAIWFVAELALTMKRLRSTVETLDGAVDEMNKGVNATLGEIQPLITKLDTTIDNLQPTLKEIQPLLNKAGTTVDALSLDFLRLDEILADISDITNTAANASNATNSIASNAADVANTVLGKIKTKIGGSKQSLQASLQEGVSQEDAVVVEAREDEEPAKESTAFQQQYFTLEPNLVTNDEGYFKYGE
ncbi:MAG: DUF948 domain-containing protein [Coriobacteriia bacterium]|nr:DUF948 domain-containing protein [Coriobacteriia bacterium]